MSPLGGPARKAATIVLVLFVIRLAVAAMAPLHFDEAYYWLWSKNLAAGYYDHPPMVAWIIRFGTALAGNTELGVRLGMALLSLPLSWVVYRTAEILFENRAIGLDAAIYLNLTLFGGVGMILATPDAPLLVAAACVLYSLAKLVQTRNGVWWIGAGFAVGAGLLSKYNAFFFGASILLWVVVIRQLRFWLLTPWPYLGGLIALGMFAPVFLWNAEHDWISFHKQFSRVLVDEITWRYIFESLLAQVGLATPPLFALGAVGLVAMADRKNNPSAQRALIEAMIWPAVVYFAWHSLHARVNGNWLAPVYPAFAIAAAFTAHAVKWQGIGGHLIAISRRFAVPTGLVLILFIEVQACFAPIPLGAADPTASALAAGFRDLSRDVESARKRLGATAVVTGKYAPTGWLSFYLPANVPVIQLNEPYRWIDAKRPDAGLFDRALYVYSLEHGPGLDFIRQFYGSVGKPVDVARTRNGVVIDHYRLVDVEGFKRQ